MSKELKIRVGEEVAKMVLLKNEAPKTCQKALASLPLRGNLIHAKIAGNEFFFKAPFFCEPENQTKEQKAGNVCFYDNAHSICVFYGDVPGIGAVNLFAKIIENLEGIQKEGQKGWKRQGAGIEIYE